MASASDAVILPSPVKSQATSGQLPDPTAVRSATKASAAVILVSPLASPHSAEAFEAEAAPNDMDSKSRRASDRSVIPNRPDSGILRGEVGVDASRASRGGSGGSGTAASGAVHRRGRALGRPAHSAATAHSCETASTAGPGLHKSSSRVIHTSGWFVYGDVNYISVPATYRITESPAVDSRCISRGGSPGEAGTLRQERPVPSATSEVATRLIRAIAQDRSEEAFAELFDRYAGRLKYFFVRGGIETGRAEELSQDVLLTVWRRADSFDDTRSSALTWLYTMARNRRIDEFRRSGHAAPRPEDLAWDSTDTSADDGLTQDIHEREALREALLALPEEQRDVLERSFFDGRSLSEIASDAGLPLGTVKSRARLALQRLRRALHPQEEV